MSPQRWYKEVSMTDVGEKEVPKLGKEALSMSKTAPLTGGGGGGALVSGKS